MKTGNKFWQLTVLCIMAVFAAIHAAEVGENDILTAARKWIADNAVFKADLPNAVPEKAEQMTDAEGKAMPLWRVDLQPTGYLVMSSDDTLPPVVAFNTKGSFDLPEGHPLPDLLKRQREIFEEELAKPQTRGNEFAQENRARWNVLLNRTRADSVTPSEIITAPMMTTKWNQNTPYNYLCPSGETYIDRAVTGCVPTAIAQILKYHEWPSAGQGTSSHQDTSNGFTGSFQADYSFPYDWSLMRDNHKDNWNYTYPLTKMSRSDWIVGRLMLEMGVAVYADYKTTSTSGSNYYFRELAIEKLGYSTDLKYGQISADYSGYVSPDALYPRVIADMRAGRPALMSGERYEDGTRYGHSFIADGLATMAGQNYCHFNYGWSGSEDGWYLMTDASSRSYVVDGAVTNILPKPIPVFRPMSVEQASSFTLAWDFPKRLTAEAFRLTKTSSSTSTVVSSSIAGTARSYSLTGQSETSTFTLEAKVDGDWQAASDGITVTVKTNPTPMLSLMFDDELNSVAGQPFTTTVVANNTLQSLTVSCTRPDMIPDASFSVTGSGDSRIVSFTPASGLVGNAILYITGVDTVGNVVKQTALLRVLENSFTWNSTFNNAQNRALLTGRLILMVSGEEGDTATTTFMNTVCENADIKANLLANYELWYDSSLDGRSSFASDLGNSRPFIVVIDPSGNGTRLRAHGGPMTVTEAKVFLDPLLPYFSLTDTTLTAGTTQSLELSVLDPNAEIRYRLNSSAPTISDMIYTNGIPLSATTTVSARAFKYGLPVSDTVTKTFTFLPQVATPLLNVSGQQFFSGSFTVTATCATTGATLRYTTDGTKPIGSSPVFPSAGLAISDDVQLMVCAFKDGMKESEIATSQLYSMNGIISGDGIEIVGDETDWFLQAETYNSAPSAMQSQAIDDNGSTTMTAMVTGNGELSFYWKVSSEKDYDMLAFAIDGVKKAEISGTTEWEQKTFTVTGEGEHKLVWTYSKDRSVFSGSDCGWVDDIVWLPDRTLVSIAISGPGSIATASTATYTCTATWSDGTTSTVTPNAVWSLDSETYASVNAGVVTNKNATTSDKTVTLNASYTANGVTKTAAKSGITLAKKELRGIAISGPDSIAAASTASYTCTASWSYGNSTTVTPTWSLSSTTYASVSTGGVVTNKNMTTSDKTVTLNASYTANGVTKTAAKNGIILAGQAPVTLNSIAINGSTSIATASTATYTCTATWSDGTTSTVTPTWSLSSTDYASVNSDGVMTNQNSTTVDKTVTLNASYTYGDVTKTATKTVTLAKKELTSIVIFGNATIATASTATYTCMATWSCLPDIIVAPTWSLSSTTHASVSANGVVTNQNTTTTDQTVTLNASYTVNGVTKTDSKDITLEGQSSQSTQTLELAAGWNWVAFNVLPESRKVGDVLGTAGFTMNDVIQTNGDMCLFTGSGWFPGSFAIEYGRLYQIYVANAKTVVVHGEACASNVFLLTSGWNWIGNPMATAVSPSQLTHSGGWTAGDRIQSPDGNVMFMGDKWLPANGLTLEPGKGCQIYTANAGTLTFPMPDADDALYVVVDLSGGADAASYPVRYTNTAPDLNDDTCRTTELWLRRIPAGTFIMGSPEDELGRSNNETQHEVTLTQDYYIGVFECTQKQWALVMGSNPSSYKGDSRPVECVSYDMIRGTGSQTGAGWPAYGHAVDATSFMGKIQAKTGLTFDLPTEAQWEYACRAGTTTALNSGKNLTLTSSDAAMNEVGRYSHNQSDGKGSYTSKHTKVGSYLPNAWGLFDMHGNVWEWCLDWNSSYGTAAVSDPVGLTTGERRVLRGGGWGNDAKVCSSASRGSNITSCNGDGGTNGGGFRVALHPKQDLYAVVDLSGGPDAESYPVRYTNTAPDLNGDTCRTTELWLRKILKGTFMMGSPEDEVGRISNETQHQVTLTQDYYIGVFECTQKQWELVMGNNPSSYQGDCRPVEMVSYNMIRGTSATAGAGWPAYGHAVDATSFMGILQAKTGLMFDLPTEAQWEYACRAGTTTALNSGKNLTDGYEDAAMDEVGRYYYNRSDGKGGYSQHTTVGSYLPNAWGLYDMHGNVREWCLDWRGALGTDAVEDPLGANSGSYRLGRGGSWYSYDGGYAKYCRSAFRDESSYTPSITYHYIGFRIVCQP